MSRDPGAELVDVLDDAGRPVATVTRREMLCRSGMGFASLGLAGILAEQGGLVANAASVDGYSNPMLPKVSHFPGKSPPVALAEIHRPGMFAAAARGK